MPKGDGQKCSINRGLDMGKQLLRLDDPSSNKKKIAVSKKLSQFIALARLIWLFVGCRVGIERFLRIETAMRQLSKQTIGPHVRTVTLLYAS